MVRKIYLIWGTIINDLWDHQYISTHSLIGVYRVPPDLKKWATHFSNEWEWEASRIVPMWGDVVLRPRQDWDYEPFTLS